MYSKIFSAVLHGIFGCAVEIETQISSGLPYHILVGLPNQVIRESKDRAKSAIRASGLKFPEQKITQNLFPAHVRKEGAHLDLAIALGIMTCEMDFPLDLSGIGFIGGLSLDGSIRRINGVLSLVEALRDAGIGKVVVPRGQSEELQDLCGVELYEYDHLKSLVQDLSLGNLVSSEKKVQREKRLETKQNVFKGIYGQSRAIRAAHIAAVGKHHILFVGPPGCGKTMIAERLIEILPHPSESEMRSIERINSFFGNKPLPYQRPFCRPHHSITKVGMIGGSKELYPGLITKAHGGVLFLDEVNFFSPNVLESLREPLSDGEVILTRKHETLTYPSDFQLVATMNPCKCGFYLSKQRTCFCTAHSLNQYKEKLSFPLLDRFDMVVYMDIEPTVDSQSESAPYLYERTGLDWNELNVLEEAKETIERYFIKGKISMRRKKMLVNVAKSIAVVECSNHVTKAHVLEAMSYQDMFRLKI